MPLYDLVQPRLRRLPRLSRTTLERHVDAVEHVSTGLAVKALEAVGAAAERDRIAAFTLLGIWISSGLNVAEATKPFHQRTLSFPSSTCHSGLE